MRCSCEGNDLYRLNMPKSGILIPDLGMVDYSSNSPALADIIRTTNAATHRKMRPSLALQAHRQAIREIALRHRVRNVRVFGSALHGNDTEASDLDLLVEPTAETTLMDIAKIQVEVAHLLHVSVDVLTPNALPDKFRDQVMAEAVAV